MTAPVSTVDLNAMRARLDLLRVRVDQLSIKQRQAVGQCRAVRDRRAARWRVEALRSERDAALDQVHHLEIAMQTRGVIEQAKGMLMLKLKIDADQAFAVLVKTSQQAHLKLVDVARYLVDGVHADPK
jgi:hypothetical protein